MKLRFSVVYSQLDLGLLLFFQAHTHTCINQSTNHKQMCSNSSSLTSFKSKLKSHFFSSAYWFVICFFPSVLHLPITIMYVFVCVCMGGRGGYIYMHVIQCTCTNISVNVLMYVHLLASVSAPGYYKMGQNKSSIIATWKGRWKPLTSTLLTSSTLESNL